VRWFVPVRWALPAAVRASAVGVVMIAVEVAGGITTGTALSFRVKTVGMSR